MKKVKYLLSLIIILISIIVIGLILKNNKLDISKSVVTIESTNESIINIGTGFVYKVDNKKSYILTNYHVIEDYSNINVYDNEKNKFSASIVKYDVYNDLAIIEVETDVFKPLSFDDNFSIKNGDKVYTLCSSLNVDSIGRITEGKIVGKIDYLSELYDFNPIEASIETNLGSSGSPVINSKGKVIGIIFLRDKDDANKSFFIPIDFVLKFIEK